MAKHYKQSSTLAIQGQGSYSSTIYTDVYTVLIACTFLGPHFILGSNTHPYDNYFLHKKFICTLSFFHMWNEFINYANQLFKCHRSLSSIDAGRENKKNIYLLSSCFSTSCSKFLIFFLHWHERVKRYTYVGCTFNKYVFEKRLLS